MQCRGIGPHLVAKGKSFGFSRVVVGTWRMFSSYGGDGPSKIMFVQRHQDTCPFMRDTSRISSRLGREIGTLLEVRRETQGPFPVATWILRFLSIFKRSHASSPLAALNSTYLSRFQRDVRPPVEVMRGPKASSSVSTGNSLIPSPCEMKDEPAFKPLRGNPAFFRDRASRSPFHLRHQTPGPFHIPTAERNLLFTCLWKVGILLYLKPGNQLPS